MPNRKIREWGHKAGSYPVYRQTQINFKGLHHFENLYKMMHDWLTSRGFKHHKSNNDNIEDYFQEYILSPGGPKNNWIWWRVKREENEMFHYHVEVEFQCLVLNSKEIVHKGEKMKFNDGEISVFIRGWLQIDPNGQWADKKHGLLDHAYHLFKEKEFIGIIDDHESDLTQYCGELFERAKQYLGLMTAFPLQKPFHPELGYPQLPEEQQNG